MARRPRQYSYNELRDLIRWSLEDCPGFGGHVEVDGKVNRIAEGITPIVTSMVERRARVAGTFGASDRDSEIASCIIAAGECCAD